MTKGRLRPRVVELTQKRRGGMAVRALLAPEYLYLSQEDGDIVQLRRGSYEEVWRQPSGGFEPSAFQSDGVLLAGGRDVNGCALLSFEGNSVWRIDTYHQPFHVGAQLLARGWTPDCPRLLARLDPRDGSVLRKWVLPEGLDWQHYLPGPRVLGHRNDLVVCYDLEREQAIWQKQYGRALVGEAMEELPSEVLSISGTSTVVSEVLVGTEPIKVHPFDDETVLLESICLARCSIADGSLVWRSSLKTTPVKPYRSGGRILVFQRRALVALDEETGGEVFRREYDPERDLHFALRETFGVSYRNRLAIPFEEGYLAIIDTDDGRIVSMHRERQALWRAAEIDGDLLLCTGGGTALVYGPEIWQF